ncbi:MAG: major facilitator superfamily 1 [Tardiphaga sp.]|jgi:predicted MFS family arabinose efflux permease|uniref:YbfB/YjiJ family MFS transporter n=1 Tax=Tardiphaga sp. TaxID=1926292 RepID=UPI002620B890|nr:YbfB/YjiJ family MFS transporter [Tardiphaga sp.]MDB5504678.1 major facilitator superfamily 1 [Tardiphaga sp.]
MPPSPSALARQILILSLAPAIGLGVGRFAYSLLLPDMRDALHWSYSSAGFMNTINAGGYLAGALVAARLSKRFGLFAVVRAGTIACVVSLLICGLSDNFTVLSLARLLTGFGAAIAFVAGGALAATLGQSQPARSSFLLSLFYAGPGVGILLSGLIAPFMLQGFGPGSWWIVWLALAAVCAMLTLPLLAQSIDASAGVSNVAPSAVALRPISIFLLSYFMFGAGYIAYMTFMIAYVRDFGGDAVAQSAFWCLVGASAFASPWVWRGVLARGRSGSAMAIILGVNAVGAAMPLLGHSPLLLGASALVFGVSFFAVVTATTAFVRFNYPPDAWPKAIAIVTIVFGIGQTLGPIAVGAISDATQSLSSALVVSAATLGIGAAIAMFQKPVGKVV